MAQTNNSSNITSVNNTAVIGTGSGFSTLGYSTTATASNLAERDSNANLSANNLISGYATTATAAGTTTLTVASAAQQYFTGTTTQTVVLPVTSTLVLGQTFTIVNNSTGVVTVQSSGANTIQAMAASTQLVVTVILTSGTTAASWNAVYGPITNTSSIPTTATSNQILQSVSSSSPVWSTATYPGTTTTHQLLYSSAANTVTGLASANNSTLVTSSSGVPSLSTTLPTAVQQNITTFGTNLINSANSATPIQIELNNNNTSANSGSRIYVLSGVGGANLVTSWIQLVASSNLGVNSFYTAVYNQTNHIYLRTGQPYGATGDILQTVDASGNLTQTGGLSTGNSTSAIPSTGIVTFVGATSGQSTISVPSVAGTCTFTIPTTDGNAGQALLSDAGAGTGYTWGDVATQGAVGATLTPGISFGGGSTGITYTTQSGEYTQIANIVYFNCKIVLSNKGSSTGAATITGLPVTTSGTESNNAISINNFGNITLSVGNTLLSGVFSASGTTINLQQTSLTGTVSNVSDTNFANNSQLTFSGFYFTT